MTDKNSPQELKPDQGYPEFDFTKKDFKGFDKQTVTPCESIDPTAQPETTAQSETTVQAEATQTQPKRKSHVGIYAGIGVAVVIVVALVIYIGGITSLKHNLTSEDWSRYEDGVILYLDFSDDEIEYSMYGSYIGQMPIADMDYKVTGPSTIKVKYGYNTWRTIHVTVDSDGILECKPALTSTDSYEFWY